MEALLCDNIEPNDVLSLRRCRTGCIILQGCNSLMDSHDALLLKCWREFVSQQAMSCFAYYRGFDVLPQSIYRFFLYEKRGLSKTNAESTGSVCVMYTS